MIDKVKKLDKILSGLQVINEKLDIIEDIVKEIDKRIP